MHYPETEMYPFFESIIERTLYVRALRAAETSKRRCKPSASGDLNVGVKISKAHTAMVNDRAAGTGQTGSRNFLEDDTTPARLLGFLFVCFCFALVLCSLEKPCRRQFVNDPLTYKLSGAIEAFFMVGQFRLQM